jgi:hypothetical protein
MRRNYKTAQHATANATILGVLSANIPLQDEELDETFSALARLLYGHKQTGYAFDPALNGALRQFVARWQNSETGFWGQWLVDRQEESGRWTIWR